jgi:tRNA(Ile)-lysidine synthase
MRNRIRLELLPLMESIAPDARASLLALSEDARSVSAMLDAIAALVILDDGEGLVASEVALARGALRCLPADAAPHAFRLALARLLGDARDFSRVHYATLGRAASAATGTMFELPRGVIATVDPDAIVLSVGAPGPAVLAPDFVAPIPYGGRAGTWKIDVHPESDDGRRGERGFGGTIISLPRDAVVRGRRPGDRVALRGGGHKKLQDLYVDAKVARRERDAAPVIACGGEVLWTPLVAGKIAAACGGAGHRVLAGRSDRPGV